MIQSVEINVGLYRDWDYRQVDQAGPRWTRAQVDTLFYLQARAIDELETFRGLARASIICEAAPTPDGLLSRHSQLFST